MFKNPHRRRQYLINKKLQLRYSLYIFATLTIVSLASFLCLSFGIWNVVVQEFSNYSIKNRLEMASRLRDYERARYAQPEETSGRLSDYGEVELLSAREKEILQETLKQNNKELALKIFFLFLFIAFGTIFLTHRVAGPLFRFQKTFQEIKNGNLKLRVHLRKNDHAQDIIPVLNSMIGGLDYSFSKIKVLVKQLGNDLEKQGYSQEMFNKSTNELQQELNRYTTSNVYKGM
ncbi:MAG: hypothetical protein KKH94_06825 [Candidatus Omnitrophica bacterium]|nr:hypothetical protein [Candidatus Omnitrophota bacterium]